jgi:hypothetical protein
METETTPMYRIDTAYKSPPSGGFSDKQNALFEAFGMCLSLTKRISDIEPNPSNHRRIAGPYQQRSNARLSGIDIKTMSMGDNPVCFRYIRHFSWDVYIA